MTDKTKEELKLARFDGYPVDCIIEELLEAEAKIAELTSPSPTEAGLVAALRKIDLYSDKSCSACPDYDDCIIHFEDCILGIARKALAAHAQQPPLEGGDENKPGLAG